MFTPFESGGRVAAVEQRIVEAIHAGMFSDGEQLPSETELASQLRVSTVTLRDALSGLRRMGLVETRRGRRGGTFVRAPAGEAGTRSLERLAAFSVDDLRDLADLHAAVAGHTAALAAARSSLSDIGRMASHADRLRCATNPPERRAADARFHYELAASSRSLRLTRAEMELRTQLGAVLDLVMDDQTVKQARAEHVALLEAIRGRDACTARSLAAGHVEREMRLAIAMRLGSKRRPGLEPSASSTRAVFAAVQSVIDEVTGAVARLRDELLETCNSVVGGRSLARKDLGPVRERLLEELSRQDAIAGCGVVFAYGALEDAQRWLEWWHRSAGRDPSQLTACLDPDDPNFYDYEQTDWFKMPRDTGRRWIAGPFVDYSGTNEPIFTLTLPVTYGKAFLGVAGADLAIRSIESVARPPLMDLAGDAILINGSGRVIASNTPAHPVGALWPGGAAGGLDAADALPAEARIWPVDDLPWSVIVEPSSSSGSP